VRTILYLALGVAGALALMWLTPAAGVLALLAVGAAAGVMGLFRLVERFQDPALTQRRC
jgi:membrane associated rhomboid family serine protease